MTRRMIMPDGQVIKPYDPADNSRRCYDEAIREKRLTRIRIGEYEPRQDDPEEIEAFRQFQQSREGEERR